MKSQFYQRVCILQKHIDSGFPRTTTSCPVALAIKDAIGSYDPLVWIKTVRVKTGEDTYRTEQWCWINGKRIELPKKVQNWISDYDDDKKRHKVKPIEFEFKMPV